jgi:hypothetical protein
VRGAELGSVRAQERACELACDAAANGLRDAVRETDDGVHARERSGGEERHGPAARAFVSGELAQAEDALEKTVRAERVPADHCDRVEVEAEARHTECGHAGFVVRSLLAVHAGGDGQLIL